MRHIARESGEIFRRAGRREKGPSDRLVLPLFKRSSLLFLSHNMNTMLGFSSSVSQHGPSRHLQALFFFTLVFPTLALNSGETWSKAQTSSAYKNLPECARTCIAQVDNSLSCWSYGCVCSENTVGKNFIDGANYVQKCVRDDCPEGSESVVNNALDVFQSICEVEYFEFSDSTTATVTATIAPTATPTFDGKNPIFCHPSQDAYLTSQQGRHD